MRKQERKGGRGQGLHTRTRDGGAGGLQTTEAQGVAREGRDLAPPKLVSADQSLLAGCLAERLHLLWEQPSHGQELESPRESQRQPLNPTIPPNCRGGSHSRDQGSPTQARPGRGLLLNTGSVTSIHPAPRIHAAFPAPQMPIPPQLSRHNKGSRVQPA